MHDGIWISNLRGPDEHGPSAPYLQPDGDSVHYFRLLISYYAKQLNHVVTQMIEASVATDDEESTEK